MSNHLRFQIRPTSPFAFDLALAYLRTSPSSIIEVVTKDTYRRAIRLNGNPALLTARRASSASTIAEGRDQTSRPDQGGDEAVRSDGTPSASVLDVEVAGSAVGSSDHGAVEDIVRLTFGTDVDVAPLTHIASADPIFGSLVQAYAGLRPVVIPDLFETVVWAILGQQINVQFAAKCKRALVERFGSRLAVDGRVYLLFPTAEQLAVAGEADLAALQLSRQKIRYTLNLAREIAEGRLDLEQLRKQPLDEARQRLEGLLGIGRWTAEYVLMRGMGHRDVIPAADGGLRRIIGQRYGLGRSATEAEVRGLASNWAGWRSYAAFYWWFTLQRQACQARETNARSRGGMRHDQTASRPVVDCSVDGSLGGAESSPG